MFNFSRKCIDSPSSNCDYNRYTLPSLFLVNGEIINFYNIPRKDSAISLKDSFLELDFQVTRRAYGHAPQLDDAHIRLVNLGPFAIFFKYRVTSTC